MPKRYDVRNTSGDKKFFTKTARATRKANNLVKRGGNRL